jgi:hypothetical protein
VQPGMTADGVPAAVVAERAAQRAAEMAMVIAEETRMASRG